LEDCGVRQFGLLLPLHPEAIEVQQVLREDKRGTVEDHQLVPVEGNVPEAEQNINQAEVSTLRHPLPARTARKGIRTVQVHPQYA
jgi:hypothetical protein